MIRGKPHGTGIIVLTFIVALLLTVIPVPDWARYIRPDWVGLVLIYWCMALPERIMTNIIEGLEKLNQVIPGVSNDETLLYAPEIKFFATQVETTRDLETKIKGMYVAGDGPGVAGNIVSAGATCLIPAKAIITKGKGDENHLY